MALTFHLPRLGIDTDWFDKGLADGSLPFVFRAYYLSFAAASPYHRSIKMLFDSSVQAKNFICHLFSIFILRPHKERLIASKFLPSKNKNIFRGTQIELRFEIAWYLFIHKFCWRVVSFKVDHLVGLLG